jgi:hypothetical protein
MASGMIMTGFLILAFRTFFVCTGIIPLFSVIQGIFGMKQRIQQRSRTSQVFPVDAVTFPGFRPSLQ